MIISTAPFDGEASPRILNCWLLRRVGPTRARQFPFHPTIMTTEAVSEVTISGLCRCHSYFKEKKMGGHHHAVLRADFRWRVVRKLAAPCSDVDSGQKVAHYSGQNCSSRVVAKWNLGGALKPHVSLCAQSCVTVCSRCQLCNGKNSVREKSPNEFAMLALIAESRAFLFDFLQ